MNSSLWIAVSALLVALSVACSSSPEVPQEANAPVPGDLSIVFGEGGGVTGHWSGHTIEADGSVYAWEGLAIGANPSRRGALAPDSLARLLAHIRTSGFFERVETERGDLTRLVRVTANGSTHEVSWVPRFAPSNQTSESTSERLMAELRAAVARSE